MNTAYKLIRQGKIKSFRVGRQHRVMLSDLDDYIAQTRRVADLYDESDVVDQWVDRVLATAPPLTDEQRTRLAELLRPVRQTGAAS